LFANLRNNELLLLSLFLTAVKAQFVILINLESTIIFMIKPAVVLIVHEKETLAGICLKGVPTNT
jgi:hypothetical protein